MQPALIYDMKKITERQWKNRLSVILHSTISIRYSTIETKEAARIGYNGFLIQHEYSGEGRGA